MRADPYVTNDREEYIAPIPEPERHDLVLAYHAQLNAVDDETRIKAARAWSKWEYVMRKYLPQTRFEPSHRMATSRLFVNPDDIKKAEEDDWANAFARIENHYFVNEGFMRQGQLLESQEIDKMYALLL